MLWGSTLRRRAFVQPSITAVIGLRSHPNYAREGGASTAPTEGMRCSTCPVADTCALRAEGRTCYGNPA
ncbi:MAG: hypothetical protein ACLUE1_02520 [Adlercreutzia equolifaciens]